MRREVQCAHMWSLWLETGLTRTTTQTHTPHKDDFKAVYFLKRLVYVTFGGRSSLSSALQSVNKSHRQKRNWLMTGQCKYVFRVLVHAVPATSILTVSSFIPLDLFRPRESWCLKDGSFPTFSCFPTLQISFWKYSLRVMQVKTLMSTGFFVGTQFSAIWCAVKGYLGISASVMFCHLVCGQGCLSAVAADGNFGHVFVHPNINRQHWSWNALRS